MQHSVTTGNGREGTKANASRSPRTRSGPLAGLRVADFCWMGVGAMATRLLADFGAEVIKIEDRSRIDLPRRIPIYKGGAVRPISQEDADPDPDASGFFNNFNRNKLGITLNMRTARGREIAHRLFQQSSIVTENFAPGVMERWGITYEYLRAIREDVIYARMSGFGHSGPDHTYRSYGPVVQAVSGLSFISGRPGEPPSGWGFSYMDNMAAYYNSSALLLALFNRTRTGAGEEISCSAVEVGVGLMGPLILEASANGRKFLGSAFPTGNRLEHPHAAPHGVYPTNESDRWCAIAVFNDAEWAGLVRALRDPAWAQDARFATQELRYANQDPLDAHLGAWTCERSRYEVMHHLQAHGVRAAAVQTSEDLMETDPQIALRGTFFSLDHPVIGDAPFEGFAGLFSGMAADNWRSAPLLGEDNQYVYGEVLGLGSNEIAELASEGVI